MSEMIYSILRALLSTAALAVTMQLLMKPKARLNPARFAIYIAIGALGYYMLSWIPYPIARILVWLMVFTFLTVIFFRMAGRQNILYATAALLLGALADFAVFFYQVALPAGARNFWTVYIVDVLIVTAVCGLFLLAWRFFSRNNLRKVYRVLYARIEKIKPTVYTHITIYLMIFISVLSLFWIYEAGVQTGIDNRRFSFYIPFLMLPVINLLGYMLYKLAIRNKIKLDEKKEKYEQLLVYTHIIEKLTRDMRRFRHDYNNILMTLSGFIDTGDMDGLRDYYTREVLENSSVAVNKSSVFLYVEMIKCVPLKGLITTAFQKAMKKDINVSMLIDDYLNNTGMQAIDLCRIMGVFLDNAIEAAKKSDEKTLSVSILKNEDGDISISVVNSFKKRPNMSRLFEEGYTTKGEGRGTGLASIASLKDKYDHVTLSTVIDNHFFIQELSINNSCRE